MTIDMEKSLKILENCDADLKNAVVVTLCVTQPNKSLSSIAAVVVVVE